VVRVSLVPRSIVARPRRRTVFHEIWWAPDPGPSIRIRPMETIVYFLWMQ
jgi:hypothetical protein